MIDLDLRPYDAKVLTDSVSESGVRLTTMIVNFPRFVLAEFNTHRVFSRNSASSRAIPVKKRIEMINKEPFVPLNFGKNKRGMSSTENLEGELGEKATELWLKGCHQAVEVGQQLSDIDVHKQFANRILEPFAFHTVIVTSTEWENYWNLRISKYAQPEIVKASESMKKAYDDSRPEVLAEGDWHLPLIFEEDYEEYLDQDGLDYESLAKISCARCARVSYLTHDGKRSLEKDLQLFDRLVSAGHMSPLEHAAELGREFVANCTSADYGNFIGTIPYTRSDMMPNQDLIFLGEFIGNFRAPWVQYRKMISGEDVYTKEEK